MSPTSDAFILVTIPNATLTSSSTGTLTGQLVLEYVTYDVPATAQVTQDVLLVLVLRSGNNNNNNNTVLFEAPLDPARALSVSSVPPPSSFGVARQRYVFQATRDDTEFTVELPRINNNSAEDIELFHSVLVGYVTDVRINGEQLQSAPALPPSGARLVEEEAAAAAAAAAPVAGAGVDEDLRGRFVLMNEDDGEIVGTLDRSVRVFEDPSIEERGREKDTLVVEVPEGADTQDGLLEEEVLVSTIPPEDQDWMVKTAVFVRYVLSLLPSPINHSLALSLTFAFIFQPCHLRHHHSSHECNDQRLELIHRKFDAIHHNRPR
jgi:spartin